MLYAGYRIIGCADLTGCQGTGNDIAVNGDESIRCAVRAGRIAIEVPLVNRVRPWVYGRGEERDLCACTDGILRRSNGNTRCNIRADPDVFLNRQCILTSEAV